MRVFRVITGSVVALVGLTVLVVGALAAFKYIGPDDVIASSPRELKTEGVAIATPPDLLDYHGNRVEVTVEPVDRDRHVFIGVAHDVDVRSYLSESRYLRILEVEYPLRLTTREVPGDRGRVIPPASLDWWMVKTTGAGKQTLSWRLEDGPYDLVIMHADGDAPVAVQVSFGIELPGAFRTALLVAVGGLVVLALGLVITGVFRRRPPVVDDDDEIRWDGGEAWSQNEFWRTSQPAPRVTGPRTPVGDPMELGRAAGTPEAPNAQRPATPLEHRPAGGPRQGPPAFPPPPTTHDQPPGPVPRHGPPPPYGGHQRPPAPMPPRAFHPTPADGRPPAVPPAPPTSTPQSSAVPPMRMAPRHAGPGDVGPLDRPARPSETRGTPGGEPGSFRPDASSWTMPSRPMAQGHVEPPPAPSAPRSVVGDAFNQPSEEGAPRLTGSSHSGDVPGGRHVERSHLDRSHLDDGIALGADYAEPPPWLPGPVSPVVPAPGERKDSADRG
jgi:hypothetical protein